MKNFDNPSKTKNCKRKAKFGSNSFAEEVQNIQMRDKKGDSQELIRGHSPPETLWISEALVKGSIQRDVKFLGVPFVLQIQFKLGLGFDGKI